jgi:hypothetical protein
VLSSVILVLNFFLYAVDDAAVVAVTRLLKADESMGSVKQYQLLQEQC